MTESELKQRIIDKIVELKQLRAIKNRKSTSDIMISIRTVIRMFEEVLGVSDEKNNRTN